MPHELGDRTNGDTRVFVTLGDGVNKFVGVCVAVEAGVGVCVYVAVGVRLGSPGASIRVAVGVIVWVGVLVAVGVIVWVNVGVGVGEGGMFPPPIKVNSENPITGCPLGA